jgi:hypothetical protein
MTHRYSGRNPRAAVPFPVLFTALAGATLLWGCSSGTSGGAASGGASGGEAQSGGSVATSGGVTTGGSSSAGGNGAFGGTVALGGTTALISTGGETSASGGAVASGGRAASGGAMVSGGATGAGGALESGGAIVSGGSTTLGGAIGSGGVAGRSGNGGAIASGGTGGETSRTGGVTGTGGGAGGMTSAGGATSTGGPSYPYIFACFNDSAALSSLDIYTSTDALNFTLLLDTKYTGPTQNLRDPSIMKNSDGTFYVVHTTPPGPGTGCCGPETSFAVATSADLKTWSPVTQVPCGIPNTTNVWAPEWFKDSDGSIHVLVSVDGKTYRYEPTDGTFTKWGAGTWIGIGPGYIDTFMVKIGTTYHAFTKLESATTIRHATSASLDGPWTFQPDVAAWGTHKEAPALIQLANGNWRIYMDAGSAGHEMYSDSTDVFQTWTTVQTLPTVGNNISHGTVIHGN